MDETPTQHHTWNVGPGVADLIHDFHDVAMSDEIYIVLTEGHRISQTFARDAVYYYYEEDGAVRRTAF